MCILHCGICFNIKHRIPFSLRKYGISGFSLLIMPVQNTVKLKVAQKANDEAKSAEHPRSSKVSITIDIYAAAFDWDRVLFSGKLYADLCKLFLGNFTNAIFPCPKFAKISLESVHRRDNIERFVLYGNK